MRGIGSLGVEDSPQSTSEQVEIHIQKPHEYGQAAVEK